MKATKTVGLGVGAAVASAAASCHIVQAIVLGMLGALGALPFIRHHPAVLLLVVIGCSVLLTDALVHVWRGRRRMQRSVEPTPLVP